MTPKQRTRPGVAAKVTFVERPDSDMIVVLDPALLSGTPVSGAYVKVSPTIRSSERASFDAAGIAQQLRERGATAVIVAPIVIPDRAPIRGTVKPKRKSAGRWLEDWFSKVHGLEPEQRALALQEALASAAEAGL